MKDPTNHAPRRRRGDSGWRRARIALIGAYLLGLATIPYAMTLGFSDSSATAGEAELRGEDPGGFRTVSWELLGGFPYEFEMPAALQEASADEIARRQQEILPERIRDLDGASVALRGYVIPTHVERGQIRSFVLAAKNQVGCCFGDGLAMNQWVEVEVPADQEFRSEPFALATVLGRLEVGEEIEHGYVLSLYRLAAQKIRES